MNVATALEFLGVLQRMDYVPNIQVAKPDANRFMRHLRSYKNRRAAWLETRDEIRLLQMGLCHYVEALAEKQAQLDRRRYLMDVASVRLEASSQNLLDCFPYSLIHHVEKLLSTADESVRRHLYDDAERCICNGSFFDGSSKR